MEQQGSYGCDVRPGNVVARRWRFGHSSCFLCSRPLRTKNRTQEHVFPRWLQNQFQLWNQSLTLINGTSIRYRQLKVPCCRTCNNEHLSSLEDRVGSAVLNGPEVVRALPELDLYLWLGKIFFGVLYKEYLLTHDRTNPKSRQIVPRELLEQLDLHHLFLQAARVEIEFHGSPGSVFVFRLQVHRHLQLLFHYGDSLSLTAACRMGNVGVLASFADGGMVKRLMEPVVQEYYERELHPLQFDELTAQLIYNVLRQQRTAKSVTIESPSGQIVSIPNLPGFSLKPWFAPWVQEHYARVLAQILGVPLDTVYRPSGEAATWLHNQNGEFSKLDVNDGTWP